jgi:hypothetical protein
VAASHAFGSTSGAPGRCSDRSRSHLLPRPFAVLITRSPHPGREYQGSANITGTAYHRKVLISWLA